MMRPSLSNFRAGVFAVFVAAASAPLLLWANDLDCYTPLRFFTRLVIWFLPVSANSCAPQFGFLAGVAGFGLHILMQKTSYQWLHRYDNYKYVGRKYRFETGFVLFVFGVCYFFFG